MGINRRDPDSGEYRHLSWQSLIVMGLTNDQVKGAIIVSWRITNLIALLWITGMLSSAGYPGPVRASEVESMKNEARDTRLEVIEARLFDLRIEQCRAIKAGESPRVYTVQIQEQWSKYLLLTKGREPRLPSCTEL